MGRSFWMGHKSIVRVFGQSVTTRSLGFTVPLIHGIILIIETPTETSWMSDIYEV